MEPARGVITGIGAGRLFENASKPRPLRESVPHAHALPTA